MNKFSGRRAIPRILFVWLLTAVGLQLWGRVIPGVRVNGWLAALAGAAVIGLFNALVWPVMIRIALPITVLTFGLGALVLNGAMVVVASQVVPGFEVGSLWSGVALTLGLALVNTVATTALAIDDDDFYYRSAVRRLMRPKNAVNSTVPGVVFLQIDGLAHDVLVHAIRNGEVATIARWLREGSHRLLRWETDWSSQTGASQAGLLHGSNADMPAFRWWEKERAAYMVTNHPRDAMEIERRHSNGRGLLAFDGSSRANVLSGDAPESSLTMSTVLRGDRRGGIGDAYFAYFANPYNVARTILLAAVEVITELWNAADDRRRDIVPRVDRGFNYALVRAWTCVLQRDLQVETVIGDMYQGRPVIYTDLLGYDEVAHHSGTERHDTLRVLRRVDRQFARLEAAAKEAPRPYLFVMLSDHGQTQGPTFRQRWGQTLEALVHEAADSASVEVRRQGDESWGYLSGSLTEAAGGRGLGAKAVRTMTRTRTRDGIVQLGPDGRRSRSSRNEAKQEPPEIVVLASGCLGLVYFAREEGRMTLEQIDQLYPRLVPSLRAHPGIGFLLIRSSRLGPVVIGRSGMHHLDTGVVEGKDPLAIFGANAARHVKRTDGFAHVADIMINSRYEPQTDEVFAFEELVGSHGGLGGPQSYPFIVLPHSWTVPDEEIVGAEAVHHWMRRWLAELGHTGYR
jgi:uncharacterized membrane protein YvlD (DUF360 family)